MHPSFFYLLEWIRLWKCVPWGWGHNRDHHTCTPTIRTIWGWSEVWTQSIDLICSQKSHCRLWHHSEFWGLSRYFKLNSQTPCLPPSKMTNRGSTFPPEPLRRAHWSPARAPGRGNRVQVIMQASIVLRDSENTPSLTRLCGICSVPLCSFEFVRVCWGRRALVSTHYLNWAPIKPRA